MSFGALIFDVVDIFIYVVFIYKEISSILYKRIRQADGFRRSV